MPIGKSKKKLFLPEKPFRILSFDGGGARGVFQTNYLELISKEDGLSDFWTKFDLICGTSVGAIIAALLRSGRDAKELNAIFDDRIFKAFPISKMKYILSFNPMIGDRTVATAEPLLDLLKDTIGRETTLGDWFGKEEKPSLAVTATSLKDSEVRVFWPGHSDEDASVRVVDVVMASTALPGCFPPTSVRNDWESGRMYTDGGLWACDPTLAILTLTIENIKQHPGSYCKLSDYEAKQCDIGINLNNFRVVNIGTAATAYSISSDEFVATRANSSKFWTQMYEVSSSASKNLTVEFARRMVGEDNYLCIDAKPTKPIEAIAIKEALKALPDLAEKVSRMSSITNKLRRLVLE